MDYIFILLSYLLGSIPFGLILTNIFTKQDIRSIGSGNIGATNVLRTGNKLLAFSTLLLDILKAVIAIYIAKLFVSDEFIITLVGFAAIIGHIFPIWLKFKGGKGIATTLAVYICLFYPLAIFFAVIWIFIFTISRLSSLSSIAAALFSPIFAFTYASIELAITSVIIAIIVVYRHKDNIMRICQGEERPIAKK